MATIGLKPTFLAGRWRKAEGGFSLLEFLLAATVFAIGLLGLASLQTVSMAQGATSKARGTASYIAHSLLDRIQAEGAVTAGERTISVDGTVALNGRAFTYIDPVAASSNGGAVAGPSFTYHGLLPDDPYYTDANFSGTGASTAAFFTTTWTRRAGTVNPYSKIAIQEFIVNVAWQESAGSNAATQTHYFSVSRYVRM